MDHQCLKSNQDLITIFTALDHPTFNLLIDHLKEIEQLQPHQKEFGRWLRLRRIDPEDVSSKFVHLLNQQPLIKKYLINLITQQIDSGDEYHQLSKLLTFPDHLCDSSGGSNAGDLDSTVYTERHKHSHSRNSRSSIRNEIVTPETQSPTHPIPEMPSGLLKPHSGFSEHTTPSIRYETHSIQKPDVLSRIPPESKINSVNTPSERSLSFIGNKNGHLQEDGENVISNLTNGHLTDILTTCSDIPEDEPIRDPIPVNNFRLKESTRCNYLLLDDLIGKCSVLSSPEIENVWFNLTEDNFISSYMYEEILNILTIDRQLAILTFLRQIDQDDRCLMRTAELLWDFGINIYRQSDDSLPIDSSDIENMPQYICSESNQPETVYDPPHKSSSLQKVRQSVSRRKKNSFSKRSAEADRGNFRHKSRAERAQSFPVPFAGVVDRMGISGDNPAARLSSNKEKLHSQQMAKMIGVITGDLKHKRRDPEIPRELFQQAPRCPASATAKVPIMENKQIDRRWSRQNLSHDSLLADRMMNDADRLTCRAITNSSDFCGPSEGIHLARAKPTQEKYSLNKNGLSTRSLGLESNMKKLNRVRSIFGQHLTQKDREMILDWIGLSKQGNISFIKSSDNISVILPDEMHLIRVIDLLKIKHSQTEWLQNSATLLGINLGFYQYSLPNLAPISIRID